MGTAMDEKTTSDVYLTALAQELRQNPDFDEVRVDGHRTILVVDDEDVVSEVTQEILETLGYRVLVACSGPEAIALYQSSKDKVDLVILDLLMPGMSGVETFDRLKSVDPQVKVILSTGDNLIGQPKHIMERGCNGFIQKPFKMQELSQKIRKVLDRGKLLSCAS